MTAPNDHDDEKGSTYRGDPDPMTDPGTPGAADTGLDASDEDDLGDGDEDLGDDDGDE